MFWWHYCKYLNLIEGMSVIVHLDIRVWMGTSYPTIKLKWPVHAQSQREREREKHMERVREQKMYKSI